MLSSTRRTGDISNRYTAERSATRWGVRRGAARLAAVVVAVSATLEMCSGCSSANTESASGATSSSQASSSVAAMTGPSAPSTATGADCNVQSPGPSGIDGVFADLAGFTVKQICPADVGPFFADPQVMAGFGSTAAGQLSQNQSAVMTVFAGELTSGSGETFVDAFLSRLAASAASAAPAKALASDKQELGGHPVTYFNVQLDVNGYTYAAGSIVVIAMYPSGGPDDAAKEGFTRILGNLH